MFTDIAVFSNGRGLIRLGWRGRWLDGRGRFVPVLGCCLRLFWLWPIVLGHALGRLVRWRFRVAISACGLIAV